MVGGALVNAISGAAAPQEGLHGPSARYLIGALSSIALEGLFAKSSFVMQVWYIYHESMNLERKRRRETTVISLQIEIAIRHQIEMSVRVITLSS